MLTTADRGPAPLPPRLVGAFLPTTVLEPVLGAPRSPARRAADSGPFGLEG